MVIVPELRLYDFMEHAYSLGQDQENVSWYGLELRFPTASGAKSFDNQANEAWLTSPAQWHHVGP